LALLIHAQNQGLVGRIHIQPHNVAYLVDEQRILQPVGPVHR
jgi:hypothetical protein